jgi:hypothetical protein
MLLLQTTVQVNGPPPGAAAGRYDVPRWFIGLAGGVVVLVGVVYLVVRALRARGGAR